MSVLDHKTPSSERVPTAIERSARLNRQEIVGLIGAILFVGGVLLEYVEVPLDNRPNAPMTPLKVRLKCAISDLLEGHKGTEENPDKQTPKVEHQEDEPKESPPAKKPVHEAPEYRYAEGGQAMG